MHPIHEHLLHADLLILYSRHSLFVGIFDTFVYLMKIIIALSILSVIDLALPFTIITMVSQFNLDCFIYMSLHLGRIINMHLLHLLPCQNYHTFSSHIYSLYGLYCHQT